MALMVFLVALLHGVLGSDCIFRPFDCSDVYKSGQTVSGIYSIYPAGDFPVWVYCQMISDGKEEDKGGWMLMVFLVAFLPLVLGSYSTFRPFDCSDVYKSGQTVSGIYSIYPAGDFPVWVYCQMISYGNDDDKGGWTVRM
ncbi:microfibril-associated glyco 4-like protein [Labeo rohita]|uniref:Microfibril-associated glyco 4-like protein n=1 Tax=Labeo rohita TaxID=84645 RepID=A0A498NXI9_LABRO|nr:microfibril-associated glyco 4-like protein [Labeo rohita]